VIAVVAAVVLARRPDHIEPVDHTGGDSEKAKEVTS
jgi:hypothetical protein